MDGELTIPFGLAELRLVSEVIDAALRAALLTPREHFSLKLAVEELMVSAVKNGTSLAPALEMALGAIRARG
jgi:hypothetical protein